MNTIKTLVTLVALACCGGQVPGEVFTFANLNMDIPDGQPAGVADFQTIPSSFHQIASVEVSLDISGNFNGDLYCYLTHGSGFAVLLNRPGRTASNLDGYDDCGFQITLSDTGWNGDIHNYRGALTPPSGSPLTGTWQPDARNVSPATVLDTDPRTARLSSFNGLDANGTWTLFVADLASGGTSVLNGWQLVIIPEPSSGALTLFGAPLAILLARWRPIGRKHSPSRSNAQ